MAKGRWILEGFKAGVGRILHLIWGMVNGFIIKIGFLGIGPNFKW